MKLPTMSRSISYMNNSSCKVAPIKLGNLLQTAIHIFRHINSSFADYTAYKGLDDIEFSCKIFDKILHIVVVSVANHGYTSIQMREVIVQNIDNMVNVVPGHLNPGVH